MLARHIRHVGLQFDRMLPNVVTTHLHANYGDNDSHDLPSRGNIDWKAVLAKLATAPRLRTHQHEVARDHGYSPKAILDDFAAALFQHFR